MAKDVEFLRGFDQWTDEFTKFIAEKGKVQPGKYRAYGYTPPSHNFSDLKLLWRDRMMRIGRAPTDSSPQKQQDLGINRDATLFPKRGEGSKLRDD